MLSKKLWFLISLLAASVSLVGCARAAETTAEKSTPVVAANEFLVKENDIWVQVGDSITEQTLYTTYLEAFIRARYPKLHFVAINSGKSGEVTIQGIIRFRYSIAAFKPTLVTSAYGMNDHIKVFTPASQFQDDPTSAPFRFANATKRLGARYVIINSSPLLKPMESPDILVSKDGTPRLAASRTNLVNKMFADKMRVVAEKNGALFLDQMTPLQTIWGANYERDWIAAVGDSVKRVLDATTPEAASRASLYFTQVMKGILGNREFFARLALPDKEKFVSSWNAKRQTDEERAAYSQYLKNWLAAYNASTPPFVRLSGYTNSVRSIDLIHPNEAGHLHMAGVLFQLMNGNGLVSEVFLDAKSVKVVKTSKAAVRDVSFKNGVLTFKRWDESLPLPIDVAARPALNVDVSTLLGTPQDLFGMSRYLLKISNLPNGDYQIKIDGEEVARRSSDELSKGVDLGFLDKGPIYNQTQKLLEAVKQNIITAFPPKGQPGYSTNVKPKMLEEAQPVERAWTISLLK